MLEYTYNTTHNQVGQWLFPELAFIDFPNLAAIYKGSPYQKTKLPTNTEVSETVRLSSSSVLMGRDSTSAEARDTTKKPKAIPQLS